MVDGFLSEYDVHTVLGITRVELQSLLWAWPGIEAQPDGVRAIRQCLVNAATLGPNRLVWGHFFTASRSQVRWVCNRWCLTLGERPFNLPYVPDPPV